MKIWHWWNRSLTVDPFHSDRWSLIWCTSIQCLRTFPHLSWTTRTRSRWGERVPLQKNKWHPSSVFILVGGVLAKDRLCFCRYFFCGRERTSACVLATTGLYAWKPPYFSSRMVVVSHVEIDDFPLRSFIEVFGWGQIYTVTFIFCQIINKPFHPSRSFAFIQHKKLPKCIALFGRESTTSNSISTMSSTH